MQIQDVYKNFEELIQYEKEGIDFNIEVDDRGSRYAIIAIHGGGIEPGTTEIARALAGEIFSFYSFIGTKDTESENEKLHITSSHYDEPRCINLLSKSIKAISIHGKDSGEEFVMVGGLDEEVIKMLKGALAQNSFEVRNAPENVNGNSPDNICNRCASKKGIQLEISRGLRDRFLQNNAELSKFCDTIKSVLL